MLFNIKYVSDSFQRNLWHNSVLFAFFQKKEQRKKKTSGRLLLSTILGATRIGLIKYWQTKCHAHWIEMCWTCIHKSLFYFEFVSRSDKVPSLSKEEKIPIILKQLLPEISVIQYTQFPSIYSLLKNNSVQWCNTRNHLLIKYAVVKLALTFLEGQTRMPPLVCFWPWITVT